MPRRLLNIASAVCLVACVTLLGMWVRSYRWADEVWCARNDINGIDAVSGSGEIVFTRTTFALGPRTRLLFDWQIESSQLDEMTKAMSDLGKACDAGALGFHWNFDSSFNNPSLTIPYWFLVLASGSRAMLFRLRWPRRFNVRSLFLATTFLAVVLAMIAWLDRAWIGR